MTSYIYITIAAISVLVNAFSFWYIKSILSRIYFMADNMDALIEETVSFRDHLEGVYGLETFYGDETLLSLIKHAKDYSETLSNFEEIYTLLDENEETDVDDEEPNTGEEAYEEEAEETHQADVFYAGSRRRNS